MLAGAVYESWCARMVSKLDPTIRRRRTPAQVAIDDRRVWQLTMEDVPVRTIASLLGLAKGSVQKTLERLRRANTPRVPPRPPHLRGTVPTVPTPTQLLDNAEMARLPGDIPSNLDLSHPSVIRLLRDYVGEDFDDDEQREAREQLLFYRLRHTPRVQAEVW